MAEENLNAQDGAANAEAEGGEESIKKKSDGAEVAQKAPAPKLIYIVLALNLVVLVALAVFVWMNLSKSQDQVSLADIEASKTATGDAPVQGGPEGAEAAAGESKFIPESFTVNLADSSGAHFAKVDVEIEVDDDRVREEVTRLKPRIRDFIVVILSSKTYDQIASVDGRDFLREEIRNKINGYLTKGQIKNVYFTQFIIQ